ncbi:FAD-binding protein [Amphibiibacter pelophylacis]|uniref:FAD-binding protein n=1 Tax=Amphibiibacter pelophylacis TaxID=1799477 RepID=A0ACC6P1M3_9BURK
MTLLRDAGLVADRAALDDLYTGWSRTIRQAAAEGRRLRLRGRGTKDSLLGGHRATPDARVLDATAALGLIDYQPSELFVTVAAGTPLVWVEAELARHGQALAFEPPRLGPLTLPPQPGQLDDGTPRPVRVHEWHAATAGLDTVGGTVAMGWSGPARPHSGPLRDHVLGMTWINGRGQLLRSGGTVIKNVAGYDLSRLMAGSMGALGLICEVTLKVMPLPAATATLRFDINQDQALAAMNRWAGQPWPITGTAWFDGTLAIRLAGARPVVRHAVQHLGGELLELGHPGEGIDPGTAHDFWMGLRDVRDGFFAQAHAVSQFDAAVLKRIHQGTARPEASPDETVSAQQQDYLAAVHRLEKGRHHRLWRLSLPSTTPALPLPGNTLIEWQGALRWLLSDELPARVREVLRSVGGHAQVLHTQSQDSTPAHDATDPAVATIHRRIKQACDPHDVFDTARWTGAW